LLGIYWIYYSAREHLKIVINLGVFISPTHTILILRYSVPCLSFKQNVCDHESHNVSFNCIFLSYFIVPDIFDRVSWLACGLNSWYLEVWQEKRCLFRCLQCPATMCPSQSTSREFTSYFCDVKMTVSPNICLGRSAGFKKCNHCTSI